MESPAPTPPAQEPAALRRKGRRPAILWGLRAKVISTFLIPALLTVTLFFWFARFRLQQGLDDELGKRLSAIALSAVPLLPYDELQPIYENYHESRSYRNLRRQMLRLKGATKVRRIYAFDLQRKSLMDTRKVAVGTKYIALSFDKYELDQVFRGKTRASVLYRDKSGTYYKTGFAPLYDKGKVVAAVAVEGGATYFTILANTQQELLFYGFLSLILVVLAGIWFARWMAAPVRQLVVAAQNIGEGQLKQPVPPIDSKDEIGFLAETMEEMRQNILVRDSQMQMMLSGIAHEVRNPLGGMELFSGLLIEELEDDEEKRSYVERIQRETRYLSTVVNSFLDYARPTPLDIRPHDWGDFLFELSMLLDRELEDKKLKLDIDTSPDLPEIAFDRSRIHQSLLNLLQNAIHASPEGGTVRLQSQLSDGALVVKLSDEGAGIEAEKIERIFEPFFTTKEKGTGLGLPLAKKFVELHQGQLTIESEPNNGTTITLLIPLELKSELA